MSHPNKILYLSYDGLSDPLGQSQILPYLKGLAEKGFEITVISFEKPQNFKKEGSVVVQGLQGTIINWQPLVYHKSPPILSTLWDLLTLWRVAREEYLKGPFQIVHCRSYLTSLIGQRLKQKFGVKVIFDMRGFWADERVEGGLWNLRNPLYRMVYRYFKAKERQFLQEADHIISLTENAKAEILSWNCTKVPISVIPTCVDMELFDPKKFGIEDQMKLRVNLGICKDDFVLLYLGSWGTWYLTNEMLDFFLVLKQHRPDAKFLIVTPDRIELENYAEKASVIIAHASRQQVPLFISIADGALFFIKPTFSKKASSATKMGEIMAMGVPWVTNTGWGDVGLTNKANNSGFIALDLKMEEYTRIVNSLLNSGFKNLQFGANIDSLSLEHGINAYWRVLTDLLKEESKSQGGI